MNHLSQKSRAGISMMLLSAVLFALMAAMVRGIPDVNSYTMVMGRFVVGILVCIGLFVIRFDKPRWSNWFWILIRGIVGGLAVVIFYWSIQAVGLAKAMMLSYTYVTFAALLAVPILGERLKLSQWGAVAVAMAGAALLCGVQDATVDSKSLLALFGGLCSGIAVIAITRCRATDSSTNIFWSQSIFGLAIAAWPVATHWTTPTTGQWLLLLVVGLLAAAGQLTMTFAYKHTGATQGSLLGLLSPVLTAGIGVLYFREAYTPGFIVGSLLILGACTYMALNPVQKTPTAQKCESGEVTA